MCGLWAFISKKKEKFSYDKFNILGWDNDERGRDSVGRLINSELTTYISNLATTEYKKFIINQGNPDIDEKDVTVAIGHTRKASFGMNNNAYAQPVSVPVTLNDGTEGKFVLVHNGTLHNHDELAKAHGITDTGKSDSMILAEIIAKDGYDVLTEYRGAATLIIKDDRHPEQLFIFKGKSRTTNAGVYSAEERPLYSYAVDDDAIYFSSRTEGLKFIGGDSSEIVDLACNTLYTFEGADIVESVSYDRTDSYSCKEDVYCQRSNANYVPSNFNNDYDDAYYDEMYGLGTPAANNKITKDVKLPAVISIATEPKPMSFDYNHKMVRYWKGRYWLHGVLLNGERRVNNCGLICEGKEDTRMMYFYKGILLKDRESFRAARNEFGKAKLFVESDNNIRSMAKYAVYPTAILNSSTALLNVKTEYATSFYTGSFSPIFCSNKYICRVGKLLEIVDNKVYKIANFTEANREKEGDETDAKGDVSEPRLRQQELEFTTGDESDEQDEKEFNDSIESDTTFDEGSKESIELAIEFSDRVSSTLSATVNKLIDEMGELGLDFESKMFKNLVELESAVADNEDILTKDLEYKYK